MKPPSDTYVCYDTFKAARASAGLVLQATDCVFADLQESVELLPQIKTKGKGKMKRKAKAKINNEKENKSGAENEQNGQNGENIKENGTVGNSESQHVEEQEVEAQQAQQQQEKQQEEEKQVSKKEKESMNPVGDKCYAVVLNRPPGHHCDGSKYSGYCFLNNTAVAIEKCLNRLTKVLILDIDIHHGDGTQKIFWNESNVLHISLHQYDGDFFPCSGKRCDYGPSRRHAAYGTNINIPLSAGSNDWDVLYCLRYLVWPIVLQYKPTIAFYSVGTDGVAFDKANPDTLYSTDLYGQVAYELTKYVEKIVVTTEGGYTTDFLANGMDCVFKGLTHDMNAIKYGKYDINNINSTTINDEGYNISTSKVLWNTADVVKCTRSDLRRVWNFDFNSKIDNCASKHCRRNDYYEMYPEKMRGGHRGSRMSIGNVDFDVESYTNNKVDNNSNDDGHKSRKRKRFKFNCDDSESPASVSDDDYSYEGTDLDLKKKKQNKKKEKEKEKEKERNKEKEKDKEKGKERRGKDRHRKERRRRRSVSRSGSRSRSHSRSRSRSRHRRERRRRHKHRHDRKRDRKSRRDKYDRRDRKHRKDRKEKRDRDRDKDKDKDKNKDKNKNKQDTDVIVIDGTPTPVPGPNVVPPIPPLGGYGKDNENQLGCNLSNLSLAHGNYLSNLPNLSLIPGQSNDVENDREEIPNNENMAEAQIFTYSQALEQGIIANSEANDLNSTNINGTNATVYLFNQETQCYEPVAPNSAQAQMVLASTNLMNQENENSNTNENNKDEPILISDDSDDSDINGGAASSTSSNTSNSSNSSNNSNNSNSSSNSSSSSRSSTIGNAISNTISNTINNPISNINIGNNSNGNSNTNSNASSNGNNLKDVSSVNRSGSNVSNSSTSSISSASEDGSKHDDMDNSNGVKTNNISDKNIVNDDN